MTARERLRRELLRGLSEENLEVVTNQPRGTLRRRRERRIQRLRRTILAGSGLIAIGMVVALTLGMRSDASSGTSDAASSTAPKQFLASNKPVPGDAATGVADLASAVTGRTASPIDPRVIPLEVRTVVLDPGHGGVDSGTLTPVGMLEKDLTWDIANRLSILLEGAGCDVVMTRPGDEGVSLKERTEIANTTRADLFLSIHVNWLPDREARGFEIYFAGPTDDPFLRDLAAIENHDSGFSVADTRRLLDGLFAGVRQQESRQLAGWVGESLFKTLVDANPDIVNRGVMRAPFAVLVATDMPAVLAEVACISNEREAYLLSQPSYRQKIAEALFSGIRSYSLEASALKEDNT